MRLTSLCLDFRFKQAGLECFSERHVPRRRDRIGTRVLLDEHHFQHPILLVLLLDVAVALLGERGDPGDHLDVPGDVFGSDLSLHGLLPKRSIGCRIGREVFRQDIVAERKELRERRGQVCFVTICLSRTVVVLDVLHDLGAALSVPSPLGIAASVRGGHIVDDKNTRRQR